MAQRITRRGQPATGPNQASDATPDASAARAVEESRVVMGRIMQPADANSWGNVHGGVIMYLVDEAGGVAAMRHTRRPCVTVAMDSMVFKEPVYIGDLLTIQAHVTWVGRTSIEVEARVVAENMLTGQAREAGTSHITYVAIDEDGRPTAAPPLLARTDEERDAMRAAEERRARRHS
ncbi:MAG: acyl-CoA thioesterase [Chloroflexota bacterium]|nr:acyl-CoA thioesterase [Chloroflexota bacterium]